MTQSIPDVLHEAAQIFLEELNAHLKFFQEILARLQSEMEGDKLTQTEARLLATRYDASIGALNALIKSHKNFEVEQPVDISDVIRFLTELTAAIEAAK